MLYRKHLISVIISYMQHAYCKRKISAVCIAAAKKKKNQRWQSPNLECIVLNERQYCMYTKTIWESSKVLWRLYNALNAAAKKKDKYTKAHCHIN